jgi:hypothetical protein
MNKQAWIEFTRNNANTMLEAAQRVQEGECPTNFIEHARLGGGMSYPVTTFPIWHLAEYQYLLKPKRKLRPWTAKEWGARIGDEFIYGAGNKAKLRSVDEQYGLILRYTIQDSGCFQLYWNDFTQLKQLDGSPCGELE